MIGPVLFCTLKLIKALQQNKTKTNLYINSWNLCPNFDRRSNKKTDRPTNKPTSKSALYGVWKFKLWKTSLIFLKATKICQIISWLPHWIINNIWFKVLPWFWRWSFLWTWDIMNRGSIGTQEEGKDCRVDSNGWLYPDMLIDLKSFHSLIVKFKKVSLQLLVVN